MPETEEQRRARQLREADQSARTMFNVFPQGALESVGRAFQRTFANPQSATMMAGFAGVNPLVANNVPEFPNRLGPLVRTDYGLPPSERPDWRNPADQWDAGPVQSRAATPFRGNAATQAARRYEGLPPHLQSVVDRENMSAQSLGVVDTSRSPLSGINAMPNASIQGMSVDSTPIAPRMAQNTQPFSNQPSFNLAGPTEQTAPLLTGRAPETPVNVAKARVPIQTPYGTIYATAEQAARPRVAEIASLPAQSARLERIGEEARRNVALRNAAQAGRELGRRNVQAMESYFAQQRAESREMREAIDRARAARIPSEIIARGAQDFQRSRPTTMPQIRSAFAPFARQPDIEPRQRGFANKMFGLQNQGFEYSGGTQPLTGFSQPSSFIEDQNRNPFNSIYGFGV